MKILGLSVGHDASACLVVDGKLISAISSERILREKKSHRLTWDVINYVLEPSGLTIEDIDVVAVGKYTPSSDEFVRIFYKPEELNEYPFSSTHPNFNMSMV